METAIVIAGFALIQGVAVAIISGLFARESKRHKKEQEKMEKRANIRAQEGLLSMEIMNANTDLTVATALAVKNGRVNGEMDVALSNARAAQRKYYDFINKIANEQIAEN